MNSSLILVTITRPDTNVFRFLFYGKREVENELPLSDGLLIPLRPHTSPILLSRQEIDTRILVWSFSVNLTCTLLPFT